MDELDIHRWAVPFYMNFLHGNFISTNRNFGAPPTSGNRKANGLLQFEML